MPVENKGWVGGKGGSAADAMWDSMWTGGRSGVGPGDITEGPLAQFPSDADPIEIQRGLRHEHEEKLARVLGNDNNFDGSTSPGGNRVVQQGGAPSSDEVVQTPESARAPATGGGTKRDSAPSRGTFASKLRASMSAASSHDGATRDVEGQSRGADHGLQVKEPAPTPKELDPRRRVDNLADAHGKSAWTGSGPQAALHNDYQKVGGLVVELLKVAGVPVRGLPSTSGLLRMAADIAGAEMSKTADARRLERNDVHPLKVAAELADSLGEEWVSWEPETIRDTLIKDAGIEPSDDVMSKIMAVKIVMRAPERFHDDWHAFEKICVALNDQAPIMGSLEDVPGEWMSNAVSVVDKLVGTADFGPEVRKYAAARLFDQGYVVAPPLLRFADEDLGRLVSDDGLRRKVILAYAKAVKDPVPPEDESAVSVQVRRLMRNNAYVLDRLDESREQMA